MRFSPWTLLLVSLRVSLSFANRPSKSTGDDATCSTNSAVIVATMDDDVFDQLPPPKAPSQQTSSKARAQVCVHAPLALGRVSWRNDQVTLIGVSVAEG